MQLIKTKHITLNVLRRVPKSQYWNNTSISLRYKRDIFSFNLTIYNIQLFYISLYFRTDQ